MRLEPHDSRRMKVLCSKRDKMWKHTEDNSVTVKTTAKPEFRISSFYTLRPSLGRWHLLSGAVPDVRVGPKGV